MKKYFIICTLVLSILLLGGCGQQNQKQNMDYIGSEQAKVMALQEAGLTAEDVVFKDVALDKRNGIDYYDVEFTYQNQVYEYDIDALTGTVIEKQTITSGAITSSEGGISTTGTITAEDAKSKALSHAGLKSDQVSFVRAKMDVDDGRQVYDVEFYTNAKEYDYEIDAKTGEIISYDYDADSYTPPASSNNSITADKAKSIALGQVPGAAAKDIYEFETDYDDGKLVYEGKIIYNNQEYEFEIDGYSGAIRSWESDSIYR